MNEHVQWETSLTPELSFNNLICVQENYFDELDKNPIVSFFFFFFFFLLYMEVQMHETGCEIGQICVTAVITKMEGKVMIFQCFLTELITD